MRRKKPVLSSLKKFFKLIPHGPMRKQVFAAVKRLIVKGLGDAYDIGRESGRESEARGYLSGWDRTAGVNIVLHGKLTAKKKKSAKKRQQKVLEKKPWEEYISERT